MPSVHDERHTGDMDLADFPPLAPGVETLFDAVADDYDQSGAAFFVPIATRLVEVVDPQPRERALDIGCGRGAATALLADAVGPEGSVTAFDLSGRMVEHTRALVPSADVRKLDALDPDLPDGAYDVATASLVIFFLADPAGAAARWLQLLAPGGRLAVSTFGAVNDLWERARRAAPPVRAGADARPAARRQGQPLRPDGRPLRVAAPRRRRCLGHHHDGDHRGADGTPSSGCASRWAPGSARCGGSSLPRSGNRSTSARSG